MGLSIPAGIVASSVIPGVASAAETCDSATTIFQEASTDLAVRIVPMSPYDLTNASTGVDNTWKFCADPSAPTPITFGTSTDFQITNSTTSLWMNGGTTVTVTGTAYTFGGTFEIRCGGNPGSEYSKIYDVTNSGWVEAKAGNLFTSPAQFPTEFDIAGWCGD